MDATARFLEALEEYSEAKADLREALKTCERDAGYFLHREYKMESTAKEAVGHALKACIAEALGQSNTEAQEESE